MRAVSAEIKLARVLAVDSPGCSAKRRDGTIPFRKRHETRAPAIRLSPRVITAGTGRRRACVPGRKDETRSVLISRWFLDTVCSNPRLMVWILSGKRRQGSFFFPFLPTNRSVLRLAELPSCLFEALVEIKGV